MKKGYREINGPKKGGNDLHEPLPPQNFYKKRKMANFLYEA